MRAVAMGGDEYWRRKGGATRGMRKSGRNGDRVLVTRLGDHVLCYGGGKEEGSVALSEQYGWAGASRISLAFSVTFQHEGGRHANVIGSVIANILDIKIARLRR